MMRFLLQILILLSLSPAMADCKNQLVGIIESAEHLINTSSLDPRCKKLGLWGGKPGCIQATEGTIWELKALLEPVINRATTLCKQSTCSQNKSLCLGLLADDRHLAAVGVYGLLEDIESAPWLTSVAQ